MIASNGWSQKNALEFHRKGYAVKCRGEQLAMEFEVRQLKFTLSHRKFANMAWGRYFPVTQV
jgi:hypothetical protein